MVLVITYKYYYGFYGYNTHHNYNVHKITVFLILGFFWVKLNYQTKKEIKKKERNGISINEKLCKR